VILADSVATVKTRKYMTNKLATLKLSLRQKSGKSSPSSIKLYKVTADVVFCFGLRTNLGG
ncbi:unnamed protein product, partial [Candidula unifasciata]